MRKRTLLFRLRQWAALCLTLTLLLAMSAPALAASASGADVRLTATEGTVALKNSSGKTLSVRDAMKLYSGYVLSTSAKSYAYVTLDSTKVVKLDASTTVEIRKSGTKLEVLVSAGKLFFNVKAPLSSDESLNIRTSTMVTGIRGTSGMVEVVDGETSAVSVYDGQVTVTTVNTAAESGFQITEVAAGQTGTSHPVGNDSWQVSLEGLTAEDIPGFVAVELAKDPDLQKRIENDTDLPVTDIAASAQEKLMQDEARVPDGAGPHRPEDGPPAEYCQTGAPICRPPAGARTRSPAGAGARTRTRSHAYIHPHAHARAHPHARAHLHGRAHPHGRAQCNHPRHFDYQRRVVFSI